MQSAMELNKSKINLPIPFAFVLPERGFCVIALINIRLEYIVI